MKKLSLYSRLVLFFTFITLIIWGIASVFSFLKTQDTIDELFDTQQMLFAKRLATANLSELEVDSSQSILPKTRQIIDVGDKGKQDDDALGFAVYDSQGNLLLSDNEHGNEFGYSGENGFVNKHLESDDDDVWRILYISTPDRAYTIAVGQELNYRHDLVMEIVLGQLLPWLPAFPLIILMMAWIIRSELKPLKQTAQDLSKRKPDDDTPISVDKVPVEVQPLVKALNSLFKRVADMLERERRFTADAAHELRTPLTALRIQSEVALIAENDPPTRIKALNNLIIGIDRTSRLVEQLLALSRLDGAMSVLGDITRIEWKPLVTQVIDEISHQAEEKNINLKLEIASPPDIVKGNAVLLTLLVTNLINNAIRYTHQGGNVTVALSGNSLIVSDNGPGVMPSYLARLGERFFRPPGQDETGSGLGLSIVKRIARLHNFEIEWNNRPEGGFQTVLRFNHSVSE